MWKNIVQQCWTQVTIWHMHIACWIPKAWNTHSEYVILAAFPLQQWCKNASQYHIIRTLTILLNLHSYAVYFYVECKYTYIYIFPLPSMVRQPLMGQGFLSVKVSQSVTHTTFGTTPLDKWSAQRRDFCLTTHNTHKRQASMPPAAFRPHTWDHTATGIGTECKYDVHEQIILINENKHKKYKPTHIKFCLLKYQLKLINMHSDTTFYCVKYTFHNTQII